MSEANPKYIVNTFPSLNAHVDEAMQYLDGDEYKILSFAERHIFGWKDHDEKRGKPISLSMFENGFITKDGKHYGGTGLGRKTIIKKLERLVKYGLLVEVGTPTPKGQAYNIGQNPNVQGLANDEESIKRQQANQKRGAKMRAAQTAKVEGGSSHDTGVWHDTGVSDTPLPVLSHDTGTGVWHDTQTNTPKPTETHIPRAREIPLPKGWTLEQFDLVETFKVLTHSIDLVPIENETKRWQKENKEAADTLIKAGVTPADLTKFYGAEYTNGYTPSSMVEILRKIGAWLAKQAPPPAATNGTSYASEMQKLTEERYKEKGLLK